MTSSKGTPATASVAARLMDAVVYESYGGGPDGLKVLYPSANSCLFQLSLSVFLGRILSYSGAILVNCYTCFFAAC